MFWLPTPLCYLEKCSFCPISPLQVVGFEYSRQELHFYKTPRPPSTRTPDLLQTDRQLIQVIGPLYKEPIITKQRIILCNKVIIKNRINNFLCTGKLLHEFSNMASSGLKKMFILQFYIHKRCIRKCFPINIFSFLNGRCYDHMLGWCYALADVIASFMMERCYIIWADVITHVLSFGRCYCLFQWCSSWYDTTFHVSLILAGVIAKWQRWNSHFSLLWGWQMLLPCGKMEQPHLYWKMADVIAMWQMVWPLFIFVMAGVIAKWQMELPLRVGDGTWQML